MLAVAAQPLSRLLRPDVMLKLYAATEAPAVTVSSVDVSAGANILGQVLDVSDHSRHLNTSSSRRALQQSQRGSGVEPAPSPRRGSPSIDAAASARSGPLCNTGPDDQSGQPLPPEADGSPANVESRRDIGESRPTPSRRARARTRATPAWRVVGGRQHVVRPAELEQLAVVHDRYWQSEAAPLRPDPAARGGGSGTPRAAVRKFRQAGGTDRPSARPGSTPPIAV